MGVGWIDPSNFFNEGSWALRIFKFSHKNINCLQQSVQTGEQSGASFQTRVVSCRFDSLDRFSSTTAMAQSLRDEKGLDIIVYTYAPQFTCILC